jgi:class 3 adenylate cyclase
MDEHERHRRRTRWCLRHLGVSLLVSGYFVVTWALSLGGPAEAREATREAGFWPGWIMLLLAVPLAIHALVVLDRRPPPGDRGSAAGSFAAADGRGLATALFTDIVASTERARELGDRRWRAVLDEHDRISRESVGASRGRVVKSTGDGILAVFGRPGDAIDAAASLRDRLDAAGIPIRAGLHTGEIEHRGADVGGIAVHIAARVMGIAGSGEILVSRTVRDLVAGSGIALEERDTHRLEGLGGGWQLYAVTLG